MAEDDKEKQTFLQKLLFYTTAFFVLLGIFSLFAFLFLVPFVIDPAFTTISLEFDERPALCETYDIEEFAGTKNCSWTSCKEGCTREIFTCTQISVRYKLLAAEEERPEERDVDEDEAGARSTKERRSLTNVTRRRRPRRAIRDYDYMDRDVHQVKDLMYDGDLSPAEPTGRMGNDSEWYFVRARLFPNVKGCGYPPMLNCTIWLKAYVNLGTNFSCYYSRIDPSIVITELDMDQVYFNLILSIAIPIPSFIASVIYLTIAYFKIYNEEEQEALVNDDEVMEGGDVGTEVPALTSGAITPGSEAFREDLASFGHQLKVAMADEMSRESIIDDHPVVTNNSNHSLSGNLSKTMTTSISSQPGPIAAV